jgi:hypothetical protein
VLAFLSADAAENMRGKEEKLMNNDRDSGEDRMDLDDPLGIAQERVPQTGEDRIRASSDEDEVRRRRRRARGEDVEESRLGVGDLDEDPLGATGIDMGGGGKGTDIKSSR